MSRLLGPPSETISSVSERASALAADQIAGAGTMAPAAAPVTDLRKSRRFMVISSARAIDCGAHFARFVPDPRKLPISIHRVGIAWKFLFIRAAKPARTPGQIAYISAPLHKRLAPIFSTPLS